MVSLHAIPDLSAPAAEEGLPTAAEEGLPKAAEVLSDSILMVEVQQVILSERPDGVEHGTPAALDELEARKSDAVDRPKGNTHKTDEQPASTAQHTDRRQPAQPDKQSTDRADKREPNCSYRHRQSPSRKRLAPEPQTSKRARRRSHSPSPFGRSSKRPHHMHASDRYAKSPPRRSIQFDRHKPSREPEPRKWPGRQGDWDRRQERQLNPAADRPSSSLTPSRRSVDVQHRPRCRTAEQQLPPRRPSGAPRDLPPEREQLRQPAEAFELSTCRQRLTSPNRTEERPTRQQCGANTRHDEAYQYPASPTKKTSPPMLSRDQRSRPPVEELKHSEPYRRQDRPPSRGRLRERSPRPGPSHRQPDGKQAAPNRPTAESHRAPRKPSSSPRHSKSPQQFLVQNRSPSRLRQLPTHPGSAEHTFQRPVSAGYQRQQQPAGMKQRNQHVPSRGPHSRSFPHHRRKQLHRTPQRRSQITFHGRQQPQPQLVRCTGNPDNQAGAAHHGDRKAHKLEHPQDLPSHISPEECHRPLCQGHSSHLPSMSHQIDNLVCQQPHQQQLPGEMRTTPMIQTEPSTPRSQPPSGEPRSCILLVQGFAHSAAEDDISTFISSLLRLYQLPATSVCFVHQQEVAVPAASFEPDKSGTSCQQAQVQIKFESGSHTLQAADVLSAVRLPGISLHIPNHTQKLGNAPVSQYRSASALKSVSLVDKAPRQGESLVPMHNVAASNSSGRASTRPADATQHTDAPRPKLAPLFAIPGAPGGLPASLQAPTRRSNAPKFAPLSARQTLAEATLSHHPSTQPLSSVMQQAEVQSMCQAPAPHCSRGLSRTHKGSSLDLASEVSHISTHSHSSAGSHDSLAGKHLIKAGLLQNESVPVPALLSEPHDTQATRLVAVLPVQHTHGEHQSSGELVSTDSGSSRRQALLDAHMLGQAAMEAGTHPVANADANSALGEQMQPTTAIAPVLQEDSTHHQPSAEQQQPLACPGTITLPANAVPPPCAWKVLVTAAAHCSQEQQELETCPQQPGHDLGAVSAQAAPKQDVQEVSTLASGTRETPRTATMMEQVQDLTVVLPLATPKEQPPSLDTAATNMAAPLVLEASLQQVEGISASATQAGQVQQAALVVAVMDEERQREESPVDNRGTPATTGGTAGLQNRTTAAQLVQVIAVDVSACNITATGSQAFVEQDGSMPAVFDYPSTAAVAATAPAGLNASHLLETTSVACAGIGLENCQLSAHCGDVEPSQSPPAALVELALLDPSPQADVCCVPSVTPMDAEAGTAEQSNPVLPSRDGSLLPADDSKQDHADIAWQLPAAPRAVNLQRPVPSSFESHTSLSTVQLPHDQNVQEPHSACTAVSISPPAVVCSAAAAATGLELCAPVCVTTSPEVSRDSQQQQHQESQAAPCHAEPSHLEQSTLDQHVTETATKGPSASSTGQAMQLHVQQLTPPASTTPFSRVETAASDPADVPLAQAVQQKQLNQAVPLPNPAATRRPLRLRLTGKGSKVKNLTQALPATGHAANPADNLLPTSSTTARKGLAGILVPISEPLASTSGLLVPVGSSHSSQSMAGTGTNVAAPGTTASPELAKGSKSAPSQPATAAKSPAQQTVDQSPSPPQPELEQHAAAHIRLAEAAERAHGGEVKSTLHVDGHQVQHDHARPASAPGFAFTSAAESRRHDAGLTLLGSPSNLPLDFNIDEIDDLLASLGPDAELDINGLLEMNLDGIVNALHPASSTPMQMPPDWPSPKHQDFMSPSLPAPSHSIPTPQHPTVHVSPGQAVQPSPMSSAPSPMDMYSLMVSMHGNTPLISSPGQELYPSPSLARSPQLMNHPHVAIQLNAQGNPQTAHAGLQLSPASPALLAASPSIALETSSSLHAHQAVLRQGLGDMQARKQPPESESKAGQTATALGLQRNTAVSSMDAQPHPVMHAAAGAHAHVTNMQALPGSRTCAAVPSNISIPPGSISHEATAVSMHVKPEPPATQLKPRPLPNVASALPQQCILKELVMPPANLRDARLLHSRAKAAAWAAGSSTAMQDMGGLASAVAGIKASQLHPQTVSMQAQQHSKQAPSAPDQRLLPQLRPLEELPVDLNRSAKRRAVASAMTGAYASRRVSDSGQLMHQGSQQGFAHVSVARDAQLVYGVGGAVLHAAHGGASANAAQMPASDGQQQRRRVSCPGTLALGGEQHALPPAGLNGSKEAGGRWAAQQQPPDRHAAAVHAARVQGDIHGHNDWSDVCKGLFLSRNAIVRLAQQNLLSDAAPGFFVHVQSRDIGGSETARIDRAMSAVKNGQLMAGLKVHFGGMQRALRIEDLSNEVFPPSALQSWLLRGGRLTREEQHDLQMKRLQLGI